MENKSIIKALAEFQKLCPAIKKDSEAGSGNFTYKYGSLPHILEAIKPHLEKAGLTYTQSLSLNEGQRCIITTLYHIESGESLQSVIDIPDIELKGMNFYQSLGSGITYLRRYTLMALLGIVAEEDDNDAQGDQIKTTEKKTKPKELPFLNPELYGKPNLKWTKAIEYLVAGGSIDEIQKKYRLSKENLEKLIEETKKAE